MQEISALSYSESTTTVTNVSRQIEYTITPDTVNANKLVVTGNLDLSEDAVAQVSTITVTAGTTGNEYAVSIAVIGKPTRVYRHKQVAGDTAATIAGFLATLIDTNPSVVADVSGAVITVKSAVPGEAFTLNNSESTTVGNVVISTTTAASGTAKMRKVFDASLIFGVNSNGFMTITSDGNFFDGALTNPRVLQRYGPISVAIAPKALAQIIMEQSA